MQQQIEKNEEQVKITNTKLTQLFEQDHDFKSEFLGVFNFYSQKFYRIIKKDEEKKQFDELFFEALKSQFFNGYLLAREIMVDENSSFPDEFFTQPVGFLTDEVPKILRNALKENLDSVIRTELTQKFIMRLLQRFENVYDLIKQTIFDVTCLGARQAFLDIKEDKDLKTTVEPIDTWLSNVNDIEFYTPQLFITPVIKNELAESWELHWWSSLNNNIKAGDITILKVQSAEKDSYILNIFLHQSIYEAERQKISEYIIGAFSNRNNIPLELISPNIAVIEDYYFF
ncbi:hypothetical protein [Metabacillus halosaccharovorans]|nr:hypothetical protein [Metabacillus halosaccharovorans]MCM3443598.1 hypothetical protein [Metabacillus halosaccharovorans]PMC34242.1 hypothetical protein CJ195_24300 [Bacillus sp. UMB0899]